MALFFKHIHRAWFLFWILFFFILFYPIYYFTSRKQCFYGILNYCRKLNSFLPSFLSGVFYSYHFEEKLDRNQTYIYCANHSSNLDIMVFCIMAHGKYHFMGKDELLQNPILKIFFSTIDIAVNRESKISAFRAFKKAGDNLELGMSLVIFPEGKIDDHYPPRLGEFKNGPFRLAIDKNIPLVPVSIANVWQLSWDDGRKYGSKPGICDIYIHKPIDTAGLSADDADVLKDKVYKLIESKLVLI
ncbi:lysophospholipid acyltransferase family protein [Pedobacter sp.]|uniref:lysophospholipid acyltransferase family protein n=1 Tax=Pedobacter sp. TaxID=1411316 RepID=UPI003D0FBD5A